MVEVVVRAGRNGCQARSDRASCFRSIFDLENIQ